MNLPLLVFRNQQLPGSCPAVAAAVGPAAVPVPQVSLAAVPVAPALVAPENMVLWTSMRRRERGVHQLRTGLDLLLRG